MTVHHGLDLSRVFDLVAAALCHEEQTSQLRDTLRRAYTESTVNDRFDRIRDAIEILPKRLQAMAEFEFTPRIRKQVDRVLQDIVAYWDTPVDVLADDGGLLGLIDDALVAHLLISRLQQWHLQSEGVEIDVLRGQYDIDLRSELAPGLDKLLTDLASDIWQHGFNTSQVESATWRADIFGEEPTYGIELGKKDPSLRSSAQSHEESDDDQGPRMYEIWYGTNRAPLDPKDFAKGYSSERDECVHYGVCEVVIPKTHKFGSIGTSWWRRWLRLEFVDDRIKVARRLPIDDPEAFFNGLRDELAASEGNQVLFYLHGYNVSFDGAAIRAAQLFADLKVPGRMAFFSWPSKASVADYFADVERISESEAEIAEFLTNLVTELGEVTVHIIAHSMGNRGLARAIQRITGAAEEAAGIRFGQIILAAPDISIGLFQELACAYPELSTRTTMYVSARDRALGLSQWLQDATRAGFTPPVTVVPRIDTIEASNIDLTLLGHGYYAEAEAVLYDIASLIRQDAAPEHRPRLHSSKTLDGKAPYWVIGA